MEIIDVIGHVHAISKESKLQFSEIITTRSFKKGHSLLNLWQVDREFHFIVKGSGRVYYMKNGIDVTDYIAMDGHFLGGVESLFTKEPSHKAIELTEDSLVQSFVYSKFEDLCAKNHELETLGRKLAIFAFLECQKRIESLRFLSAAERYHELEKKYPGITNRISLKHLASYLATTQVSISRIRSGLQ